jgi:hypothetical protein
MAKRLPAKIAMTAVRMSVSYEIAYTLRHTVTAIGSSLDRFDYAGMLLPMEIPPRFMRQTGVELFESTNPV